MMWLHKWLSSLLLVVLLSGCSLANDTSRESRAFEKMYSGCELNTVVQFLPLQEVEYKTDTVVNLNIHNTSPNPVVFPVDLNLRIIFFDAVTQAWSDIKNDAHYLPAAPQILDPADSGLGSYDVISFIPVLSEEIPVSARVVVSGNISDEDGKIGECVGAYTDILITPRIYAKPQEQATNFTNSHELFKNWRKFVEFAAKDFELRKSYTP